MIYEYPKEFIVPVVYVQGLLQKRNEAIREWNLLVFEEGLQGNKINSENIESNIQNQGINFLDMHQELLKKPYEEPIYNYNMAQEISDNENIKSILNDIDEDYAISETLSM